MSRSRVPIAAAALAHIFAWAATVFFLFVPVYRSNTGSTATLVEVNGLSAALLLVVPVALTAVTLMVSLPGAPHPRIMLTLRWTTFAFMLLFSLAGAASIGMFYIPATIAVFVAASVQPA